jgi:hypothetical protein
MEGEGRTPSLVWKIMERKLGANRDLLTMWLGFTRACSAIILTVL